MKYIKTKNAIKKIEHEVCIRVEQFEELEKECYNAWKAWKNG